MKLKKFESVDRWLTHVAAEGIKSEATEKTYLHFLNRFSKFVNLTPDQIIEQRNRDLKEEDEVDRRRFEEKLRAFRVHLESEGLARSSVATAHNIIKSFMKANYVPLLAKSPKSWPLHRHEIPTKEELAKMVKVCRRNSRNKAIIMVLAQTGVSLKDFLELITYRHVKKELDMGLEPLHLPMERSKIKKYYDCFIGTQGIMFVREYLDTFTPKGPLFNIGARGVQYIVKRACTKARIKKRITPHRLRAFFSTALKMTGCPNAQIEYWMGHIPPYGGAYFVPHVEKQRELYKKYEWALSIE